MGSSSSKQPVPLQPNHHIKEFQADQYQPRVLRRDLLPRVSSSRHLVFKSQAVSFKWPPSSEEHLYPHLPPATPGTNSLGLSHPRFAYLTRKAVSPSYLFYFHQARKSQGRAQFRGRLHFVIVTCQGKSPLVASHVKAGENSKALCSVRQQALKQKNLLCVMCTEFSDSSLTWKIFWLF